MAMPEQRRGHSGKASRSWTVEDDLQLRSQLAERKAIGDIASGLDRTTDAIRGRAQKLGLSITPRLRPWRAYPKRKP
jgi:hypothetical protein